MGDNGVAGAESIPQSKVVVYCGVCSLPPEYCEFGGTTKKCEEWLKKHHPSLHGELYSEAAIEANLSTLSLDAQKRAEKDAQKKAAKAATAEAKEVEKKAAAKVYIKRVERNKRKYVTAVAGLEEHGLELKKVAKDLGKKFATGSSVTKMAAGGEEITVQGDLTEGLLEYIVKTYKGVPEDNIECIDESKKKKAAAAAAAIAATEAGLQGR
ncbi:density-regulated protein DRP1 [Eremomyces bilateralis CBS 781.70]|uniref:Translation machinery-associated protein 22 n=1 Tax=Eremomyces bilateralis CBS 781.70 TaxID=1392243 RepID=A0A6G1G6P8_9PEZI|nr:density-regulated protein DRP1 [Eremomyces bilateralis CBS 781.70]KAF1813606.1 density-regulated protein DRP1 [Eremomyces bilateralis CBS 781.70]